MSTHITASALQPGQRFKGLRADEGILTVVCPLGACIHDPYRDEYNMHVRAEYGNEYFWQGFPDAQLEKDA